MKLHAFFELEPFVRSLKQPRRILLSIPAGKPVEMTLEALRPLLGKDDIVIDGGNEHFTETVRRENETHFHFCGMGISGGADGARHGPSMMPGGSTFAYAALQPILQAMCAKINGESCVTHVGSATIRSPTCSKNGTRVRSSPSSSRLLQQSCGRRTTRPVRVARQ